MLSFLINRKLSNKKMYYPLVNDICQNNRIFHMYYLIVHNTATANYSTGVLASRETTQRSNHILKDMFKRNFVWMFL